jgi:hypothetical protein
MKRWVSLILVTEPPCRERGSLRQLRFDCRYERVSWIRLLSAGSRFLCPGVHFAALPAGSQHT